ncbi:MAG TPA: glycoside hydrolase family 44 protein [Candidatus Dormibacteraeota bacterium]|nr:glycoside hydrolase family 44 protein [Candidatus Dormibacteraeota bacterium]
MIGTRWHFLGILIASFVLSTWGLRSDQQLYNDSLQNGWMNYGWATINYANTSPVHSGADSISVKINSTPTSYEAIYIAHNAMDSSSYTNLSFWINGGVGGQLLRLQALIGGTAQPGILLPALPTNSWVQMTFSLASLGVANQQNFTGFWIIDTLGAPQPIFYLDDIALVSNGGPPVTNIVVHVNVDAQLNRHSISPLIYGVAVASSNQLADLNAPLNRSGGNAETRYNWLINTHNRGADWYFESLPDNPAVPGASDDSFVADSKNGGAQPLLTIPMIGWAPKLGSGRASLVSYATTNYGPQTGVDPYLSIAGNGVGTNSITHTNWLILTNNPNDANFPTNSAFQQALVRHLTNIWGTANNGGVRYYIMDNEHSIWHGTHRDVHPVGATMQEIRDKMFDYAGVVKSNDSGALVLGPEEWGWSGYLFSGYDQQYGGQNGWNNPLPDRTANGGWDYMPWLMDQLHQRDVATGRRLLDYFTLHIYPQGGESGNDISSSMQLLRNRSTRSLWDTNYVDASWINSIVRLIPRMKNWVSAYYPGTKIGITEYNWGAEANINGATAQADILGIFGRESLDLATRWTTPDSSTPTYKAMKMYRNYDGNKGSFGDTSVNTTLPNPDQVSAFSAIRSTDNALTLMLINKQLSATATSIINLSNFVGVGAAQVWQLTSANAMTRLSDLSYSGNAFTSTVPAQSITLFVLTSPPRLRTSAGSDTFSFWLDGQAGQRYVVDTSSNLFNWSPFATNTPTSNSWNLSPAMTNGNHRFYRARWLGP